MKEFFLVVLPGFEDLAQKELLNHYPQLECQIETGGVSFKAPLKQGLGMNLVLKIPTRILMRIERFRCKDFPKLFQAVANHPWEQKVDLSCQLDVQAASHKSRVKIKSRIEETALKGWKSRQKKMKVEKPSESKLKMLVRFLDDECTISLDTSGERLHKRGERKLIGEAPLRETIAASLIQWTLNSYKAEDQNSLSLQIVDPMMGAGTFLIEALGQSLPLDQREFAFKHFKQTEVELPKERPAPYMISELLGFESDTKSFKTAEKNLGEAKAKIIHEDFFKTTYKKKPNSETLTWVFCNPPYGERLKVKEDLKDYYTRLLQTTEEKLQPDRACFLFPNKSLKGLLDLPKTWKVLEKRKFSNGGIGVTAFLFGRKL